jgi:signal transduction histidine kinase
MIADGMAHDLNNLLAPIVTLSRLALDGQANSNLRNDLLMIHQASRRAQALVRRVRAFVRDEDGTANWFEPATVVGEALGLVRSSIPRTTRIEQVLEKLPVVFGDSDRLYQIVVNLVMNAAAAIENDRGAIFVTLSLERSELSPQLQALQLRVTDNGCGMDKTTLNRAFEPRFSTRRSGGGAGLGLSLVQDAVAFFQGAIEIETDPGAGTSVNVLLPLAPPRLEDELSQESQP